MNLRPLRRSQLPVDAQALAVFLLGKYVVLDVRGGRRSGRIVETEAYVAGDEAAHTYRGPTPRNRPLYLARGHAYVYVAYGTSFLLNVSAGPVGVGTCVLIRAMEPRDGIAALRRNRSRVGDLELMRGPGKLCRALGIDKRFDGVDLCGGGALWLGSDGTRYRGAIVQTVRVGITKAADVPLRYYERDNPYVSYPRRSAAAGVL